MDRNLQQEYNRRYNSQMKFLTGRPGITRAAMTLFGDGLPGKKVVDCGCGAGRSSFALARAGATVEAFDFSEESIGLCGMLAGIQVPLPVTFAVCEAHEFGPRQPVDLCFMLDVLEHVPAPVELLARARDWVEPGGSIVVSCPSFLNPRGVAWMVLQEYFDMLMSPSDLTQIFPSDLARWSQEAGIGECRLVGGTCYGWGWAADAVSDMKRRIMLATRDKAKEDPAWAKVEGDQARLDAYLEKAANDSLPVFDAVRDRYAIPTEPLKPEILPNAECEFEMDVVRAYLSDAATQWHDGTTIRDDFFVVTEEPWSRLGAIAIYELRV